MGEALMFVLKYEVRQNVADMYTGDMQIVDKFEHV